MNFDCIKDHPLFAPMNEYLKKNAIAPDYFLEKVSSGDTDYISQIIAPIFRFGMISIIIPFNEILRYSPDLAQCDNWKRIIKEIDCARFVERMEDNFHSKIVSCYMFFDDYTYPVLAETYAKIQSLLWEVCGYDAKKAFTENSNYLGLFFPSLFCHPLDKSVIESLNHKIIPRLCELFEKYYKTDIVLSKYEMSLLENIARTIAGEIGTKYHYTFSIATSRVLNYSESQLSTLRAGEYKKLFFDQDALTRIPDYCNYEWPHALLRLSHICNCYIRKDISLSIVAILLLQCSGQDEIASAALCELIEHQDFSEICDSKLIFVALFRAISKANSSEHDTLLFSMRAIWGDKQIPQSLLAVIQNIIKFYEDFSHEVTQRFNIDHIHEILNRNTFKSTHNHDEIEQWLFYRRYQIYLENKSEEYPSSRDIKYIKWISDFLFENGQLVSLFLSLYNQITEKSNTYGYKLKFISEFYYIFCALTSHIESNIRISVANLQPIFQIDRIEKYEIFDIYTDAQAETLKELRRSLIAETNHLPSYSTTCSYELLIFDGRNNQDDIYQEIQQRIDYIDSKYNNLLVEYHCAMDITSFLWRYALTDEALNDSIMKIFVNNPDITKEFCDYLDQIIYSNDYVQNQKNIPMLQLREALNDVVSHPEKYKGAMIKDSLKKAGESFLSCLPIISTATEGVKVLYHIKKAIDQTHDT